MTWYINSSLISHFIILSYYPLFIFIFFLLIKFGPTFITKPISYIRNQKEIRKCFSHLLFIIFFNLLFSKPYCCYTLVEPYAFRWTSRLFFHWFSKGRTTMDYGPSSSCSSNPQFSWKRPSNHKTQLTFEHGNNI